MHIQSSLEMVVVDEADLLFSFGHEKDMKQLLRLLCCSNSLLNGLKLFKINNFINKTSFQIYVQNLNL